MTFLDDDEWRARAACRDFDDPSFFFPSSTDGTTAAMKFCKDMCSVKSECLEFALATNQDQGVWGGCSERERVRIKRRRREGAL